MTTANQQVRVISLYGLGPDAHVGQCQCGWRGLTNTKEKLHGQLTSHFLQSPECYHLSKLQARPQAP